MEGAGAGLDARARRLLDLLALAQEAPPGERTPSSAEHRRLALRQLAEMAADWPIPSSEQDDLSCPGAAGEPPIGLRRFRPSSTGRPPHDVMLYAHGGGWVAGDLDTHHGVCRALAQASGCLVLSVDYRRAPEHRFPAAVLDMLRVADWVAAGGLAPGGAVGKLVMAGDSAGGNVAAAACLMARERGSPAIDLQLLICPILELAPATASRQAFRNGFFLDPDAFAQDVAAYAPVGASLTSPLLSPLLAPSLAGSPPTQVHVAEFDPFRDEGVIYGERLAAAGVPVHTRLHAGMIHYFYALPRALPYARAALQDIGAGIRSALDAAPTAG